MAKGADRLREQGMRKWGRPWLRWEDCVRSDINKVGVVGEWREVTDNRGKWKSIVFKMAEDWYQRTSPLIKGREGE